MGRAGGLIGLPELAVAPLCPCCRLLACCSPLTCTRTPPVPGAAGPGGSESLTTVLVAFGANLLTAVAKSIAGVVTGSASILAEAAQSWSDAGNEIFLLVANQRSRRPPDCARWRSGSARHPRWLAPS